MYMYIRKFYDVSNKLICVLIVIIFQYDTYYVHMHEKKNWNNSKYICKRISISGNYI